MNIEERLLTASLDTYGENYREHLLEQYKLYVEMSDRISQRRQNANVFSLSINTALLGIVGLVTSQGTDGQVLTMIAAISIAGFLTSFGWYRLLRSYRDLNTAKFAVIHAIESYLPIAPYNAEWLAVGEGKDPRIYRPFSYIEVWIPHIFMLFYGAAIIYSLLLLIARWTSIGLVITQP
jgi:hypothetical protein